MFILAGLAQGLLCMLPFIERNVAPRLIKSIHSTGRVCAELSSYPEFCFKGNRHGKSFILYHCPFCNG